MKSGDAKLLIFGFLSLIVIYKLLTPLVYATVVAYLAYPAYKKIEHWLKHRNISAGITTLIVLFVVVYPTIKVAEAFVYNAGQVGKIIILGFSKFGSLIGVKSAPVGGSVSGVLIQKAALSFGNMLLNVPLLILELFIFAILVFYFLRDGKEIRDYFYKFAKKEKRVRDIFEDTETLLRSVIYGNFTAAIIIGALTWIVLRVFMIPFSITIALITTIAALIPVIGTWIVYTPLIGYYLLIVKSYPMTAAMIVFGFFLQLMEIYLGPAISGKKSNIHPAIMLLGFIGGPLAFGIKGLILGPIILGVLKIIVDNYKKD